jgi:hypothetical protein
VGTEGFEPSQQSTCFTDRPDSPASAHPLGVTGGGRARSLPVHGRALWPVSYSHHRRAYPRRASNPRPPVCRTGAPPVELHGHVFGARACRAPIFRGADGPRTRNVSRVKAGRLCPLRPPRLASGWRDSNARPLGSGPSALTKLSHNPLTYVPGRGVEPRENLVLGQAPFPIWPSGRSGQPRYRTEQALFARQHRTPVRRPQSQRSDSNRQPSPYEGDARTIRAALA